MQRLQLAEARHAELMTKRDALFAERLGAIQANAQAEYARLGLGKELDDSNQTIINQQREFAARMGYGQQQLDEAITTAMQAQRQNHDLQVSLVKAQAKAQEEAAIRFGTSSTDRSWSEPWEGCSRSVARWRAFS